MLSNTIADSIIKQGVVQPGILNYRAYKQVSILCYHNINIKPPKEDAMYISESCFDQQMKILKDSGYHSISPDQLYLHFATGYALPVNPVIITFDDGHKEHLSIASRILDKYGFKGVFFITTICTGKKHYLSADEIKTLSIDQHTIGCHTYSHPLLTRLMADDWPREIDSCRTRLEKITGMAIKYFAYPYGAWDENAVTALKARGFKAAFQLYGTTSKTDPLFSLRRMGVSGQWSPEELVRRIKTKFYD